MSMTWNNPLNVLNQKLLNLIDIINNNDKLKIKMIVFLLFWFLIFEYNVNK